MTGSITNVLYLSHDGLTDPLGQSQILPYVTGLAKTYSITLISFEKPARFESGKKEIQQICDSHTIRWCPLPYHRFPPVVATIRDLLKLRSTATRLHHEKPFAIVHCRSYPTALIGLYLKKRFGVKLVFDMRGFWADERVEGGLWKLSNPVFNLIYKFFKRKEKELVCTADAVITLTENAKTVVREWRGRDDVHVIPCCVDLALFNPLAVSETQKKTLRQELGVAENDFLLIYLGSLGTWYLYDEMIFFFGMLKKQYPTAKFLWLTQDRDHVEHREDFVVRMVPRNEVPAYISICNASVCFIKPSFSKRGSSATKMAEVLAMNVPVITNKSWGDVEFLKGEVNNIFVVNDYSEVPIELAQHPVDQSKFFYDFFSLESGVKAYKKVYKSLISANN